ncbi:MAG: glycosyltransferase family 39 protein [Sedimentisphaerales bacterium]|nr:glycosyltransferase family 39 protein [Sedimentisphaerales bacterium]
MTDNARQWRVLCLISAALILATLIAYEPIRHNDFVLMDNPYYVVGNPNVSGGLTLDSVIWAFTGSHYANWHPLTSLSHILDCEIFGLNAFGHHIISLIIHIANSVLLFLIMVKMTGKIWSSAFVAAAFALHPIHVESVAWISERKDVLSGLFWMLTILAYIHYAKHPNVARYVFVLLAFVLGLMSKPMVLTLPFVLLLLDYWPLGRMKWENGPACKIASLGRLF